jgi:hypothetical protein
MLVYTLRSYIWSALKAHIYISNGVEQIHDTVVTSDNRSALRDNSQPDKGQILYLAVDSYFSTGSVQKSSWYKFVFVS